MGSVPAKNGEGEGNLMDTEESIILIQQTIDGRQTPQPWKKHNISEEVSTTFVKTNLHGNQITSINSEFFGHPFPNSFNIKLLAWGSVLMSVLHMVGLTYANSNLWLFISSFKLTIIKNT